MSSTQIAAGMPSIRKHPNFQKYVSPTFQSSSLYTPDLPPIYTSGISPPNPSFNSWGTDIQSYAGIGKLSFRGLCSKRRDLYVARSHRHYLSGFDFVLHDKVTNPQLTSLRKALNRSTDSYIPQPGDISPEAYNRLIEETSNNKLTRDEKYASHIAKKSFFKHEEFFPSEKRPEHTIEAIRSVLKERYNQTSHSAAFDDKGKNTALKLGPQFQFHYESDEEEEKNVDVATSTTSVQLDVKEETKDKTTSSGPCEKCIQFEVTRASALPEEEGKLEVKDSTMQTCGEACELFKAEEITKDTPFWPCWPGNLSNMIDPVTYKIVEKPDVCCNQDHADVRPLQVFQKPKIKDFKIKGVEPAENLAPATVDYAYTGQSVKYGTASERADKKKETPVITKKQVPKTAPLPTYLEEHVLNICRGKQADPEMNPRFTLSRSASETSIEDPDLKALKKTVENIQEASKPIQRTKLPPLHETLQYAGDRVVDRLGVRYIKPAQKRFHMLHPQPPQEKFLVNNIYGPRRTTYFYKYKILEKHHCRRQYFHGHHMGSSFR